MNRRRYLAGLIGLGSGSAFAGCTEQSLEAAESKPPWAAGFDEAEIDLPVTETFDVVVEAIERADGETFEGTAAFESYLGEHGLTIEHLEEAEVEGETALELEYLDERAVENGDAHAVGLVGGGYAALVDGGYDGDELSATLLEPDGATYGEFEVLTRWAEEYADGESSVSVYANHIVSALKSR